MTKTIKYLFILLIIVSCNNTNTSNNIGELIGVEEFTQKQLSQQYTIIDLRTESEFAKEKISEKSIIINFLDTDFELNIDKLPKEGKYLIHCRSGGRSAGANKIMRKLGFKHYYELKGGIIAWKRAQK